MSKRKQDAALAAAVVVAASRPNSLATRNGSATERAAFARRLAAEMEAQELNASRLAGAVWGWQDSLVRGRTYKTARNRDRMSAYLSGKAYPRPDALKKIAAALGVEPEDLAPEVFRLSSTPPAQAKISPATGPGSTGRAHLEVNAVVPAGLALAVAQRLSDMGLSASLELRTDGKAGIIFTATLPQDMALSISRDIQEADAIPVSAPTPVSTPIPANRTPRRLATKTNKSE